MPTYKAKILNTHIELNYMEEELEILKEAINKINEEISLFNNQTGKISDSKLISFYTIKLQAEILGLRKIDNSNKNLENKNTELEKETIQLKNEIFELKR